MRNKVGFMLINFCVYLSMLALISGLAALLVQRSYSLYKIRIGLHAYIEDAYAAQDAFMYDLRLAPVSRSAWVHTQPDSIAWHVNDTIIRWSLEKDTLIRTYTHKGKSHTSIAARGLSNSVFEIKVKGTCMHSVSLNIHVPSTKGVTELSTTYGFYGIT